MLDDTNTTQATSDTDQHDQTRRQQTMPPPTFPPTIKFGPFNVASQIFHLSPSKLSYGLVNLKPLLPGHILICPVRSVPRLSQLTPTETSDLFLTVRRVSRTLERVYQAESLNVAIQDGVEAGQSVPHVHVHVIPRVRNDMEARGGSDAVYGMLDGEEGNLGELFLSMYRRRKEKEALGGQIGGPDVEDARVPRSEEEMRSEAEWLRSEIEKDGEFQEDNTVGREMSDGGA